jgi:hypothetical protein
MAFVSFRKVRGLIVFFPVLKLIIAHFAIPDSRERLLVENCLLASGFLLDISRRPLFRTRGRSGPLGPVLPLQPTWRDRGPERPRVGRRAILPASVPSSLTVAIAALRTRLWPACRWESLGPRPSR